MVCFQVKMKTLVLKCQCMTDKRLIISVTSPFSACFQMQTKIAKHKPWPSRNP